MAQLDSSIYLQQKGVDLSGIGEGFERGVRLGDMMRESKIKRAEQEKQGKIKDIYNSSTELDADGAPKFSQDKFLKSLVSSGMVQEAEEAKNKFAQQNVLNQKTNLENMRTQGELIYGAASRSKDQASYENELMGLQKAGVDISQIPKYYDPGLVKQYQYLGMTAKERAEADLRLYENRSKREELGLKRQERQDALAVKQEDKEFRRKQVFSEIEDRRVNINDAINTLDKMIEDNGTYEMTGSHNQDLDRLIDGIATDMAKLQDPQSVARPSEVEQVKKQLVESGFKNSNGTARSVLENFKAEVKRRADSAYKVRGYAAPQTEVEPPPGSQITPEQAQAELARRRAAKGSQQ